MKRGIKEKLKVQMALLEFLIESNDDEPLDVEKEKLHTMIETLNRMKEIVKEGQKNEKFI